MAKQGSGGFVYNGGRYLGSGPQTPCDGGLLSGSFTFRKILQPQYQKGAPEFLPPQQRGIKRGAGEVGSAPLKLCRPEVRV